MSSFGGMGGCRNTRKFSSYRDDLFAQALESALGDKIRASTDFSKQVWSALANVDWTHANGDDAGYSFRAAGDLIASIRGEGCYMDWYRGGPYAVVDQEIGEAMAAKGWTYQECKL